jgi:hypothetical protein
MEWDVLLDPDFEAWLREQESSVRISITAAGTLLTDSSKLADFPRNPQVVRNAP